MSPRSGTTAANLSFILGVARIGFAPALKCAQYMYALGGGSGLPRRRPSTAGLDYRTSRGVGSCAAAGNACNGRLLKSTYGHHPTVNEMYGVVGSIDSEMVDGTAHPPVW